MSIPAIAVHGGAGTILRTSLTTALEQQYLNALKLALDRGYDILSKGGEAGEAVVAATVVLEDCELFNAGKGSVFTATGEHEMDASLMEGSSLKAAAVAGVKGVKNPILLARAVLLHSSHVFLSGDKTMDFARHHNLQFEPPEYFFTQQRYDQWQGLKGTDQVQLDHTPGTDNLGTVGAVAVDAQANVAAATSTGGMTNKAWGRIGDSAIIGAGTYANNRSCAVSCTGDGEYFIRGVAAYDVACLMEYRKLSLKEAAEEVILYKIKKMGGDGGLIAIDGKGNIAMPFNSAGMYRGFKNASESQTAIY